MIEPRPERSADVVAVRDVNRHAFGQNQEGDIVDALRANGGILLSLVAVDGEKVVGHILFSPVSIAGQLEGAALGPMAVLPEFQRRGIGRRLIEAGIARLKENGCAFILVVGHAEYYPRFGFEPARSRGIECPWPVSDDVFLVLPLAETKLKAVGGLAKYRPEFSSV